MWGRPSDGSGCEQASLVAGCPGASPGAPVPGRPAGFLINTSLLDVDLMGFWLDFWTTEPAGGVWVSQQLREARPCLICGVGSAGDAW